MNEQALVEAVTAAVRAQLAAREARGIPLSCARALIARVEARAKALGVNAVVAVADAAGHPIAIESMDGAYIASFDIALQKSFTVVALKMPTTRLKALAQPGAPLYGIEQTNQGRLVIFGGGVPLMHAGRVVGGLGVSGGSEEQDTALAEYGGEIFAEVYRADT